MEQIVKVKLHGHLGDAIGEEWNLAVKSVKEAIHAVDVLSKRKLSRYLGLKEQLKAKYKILINNEPVKHKVTPILEHNVEEVFKTELVVNNPNLRTIDIVPVIEGSDMNKLLGGILLLIGVVLIAVGAGALAIMAGISLIIAGIAMFLNKPPSMAAFRNIDQGGASSYFFGGAINIMNEGGPVPVGYGECVVGSQVISVGFEIGSRYYPATTTVQDWEEGVHPETRPVWGSNRTHVN